ncbi:hypothetical protein JAAARDRAFT_34657 [Jaapia argillacea MUCL 33604]|uniref:Uncharacterized protein n=1 Tax=Jaapia argillacea MUCL 33604 TaxID=933084 RepID=A0A067Q5M2_9AGAM|nr:hypothetical protein JAAARDRAFT_34657 [Jaapia argillacea MUCL 33604]
MSSSPKSRPMAFVTLAATSLALGAMYYAGVQSKKQEGPASVYKASHGPQDLGGSDARLGSSSVIKTMHGQQKP